MNKIQKIMLDTLGEEGSYTEQEEKEIFEQLDNNTTIPDSDVDELFKKWDLEDEEELKQQTSEENKKIREKINIENEDVDNKVKRL